jgi:6-phosphogluconolactonase
MSSYQVPSKTFALVGNFGFGPEPKGITVFGYDPTNAEMRPIGTYFEDANIGHISVDAERHMVYAVDERPSLKGQTGGGGYLMALDLDPRTGELNLVNGRPTLSQEPCYTLLDRTRRFLVVSHHADSGFVTKVKKTANGYSTEVVFDDTGLVLFELDADGSVGDVCDVALTPGDGAAGPHPWARHHSVVADPTGELLVVCDKGLEVIHTFRIDREQRRLVRLQDTSVAEGLVPRYGVFHPTMPVFYANYERNTLVQGHRYDIASGALTCFTEAPLFPAEDASAASVPVPALVPKHPKTLAEVQEMEAVLRAKMGSPKSPEPADLVIHPCGKWLYVSTRFKNSISVLDVDETGALALREVVDCGGANPRGLAVSPDGRYLFAANMDSGTVTSFAIESDGGLRSTGTEAKASSPGGMKFIEV